MNQEPFSAVANSILANTYFLLRHGTSVANEQGLIVSSAAGGLVRYGLNQSGIAEVRASIQARKQQLANVARIYSSDFLRTRETAEIASAILDAPIELSPLLRERGFGDWDGQSSANYARVWQRDAEDSTHEQWNVESVQSVAHRMVELVLELEQRSTQQSYMLVSHGDPLQILLTVAAGHDLRRHRQLKPLRTAEIRSLRSPEGVKEQR